MIIINSFPFNNKAFTSSIRTAIGYKESSLVESADIFIFKTLDVYVENTLTKIHEQSNSFDYDFSLSKQLTAFLFLWHLFITFSV